MITQFNGQPRMARFGSGAVVLRARGEDALEEAQIAQAVPSIFAGDKHGSRSERYTYIPTIEVLRGLMKEGFRVAEVRQGGSRDEEKRGFTKHMIRMRHAGDSLARMKNVGDVTREVVLLNSHDGTSSYQLMNGLFRLVCTNGLITCEGGQMQRVAHKGDIIGQVIEGAYTVLSQGEATAHRVGEMAALTLSRGEQEAFAAAALELRFNAKDKETGEVKKAPIEPQVLLEVHRADDAPSTLWNTFNRVQENVIQGGGRYIHRAPTGRRSYRETRPVNSIDSNVAINRALWTLATKMQELKAA